MTPEPDTRTVCQICGKAETDLVPAAVVRPAIAELVRRSHHTWNPDGFVCQTDLGRFRSKYVESLLEDEKGELTAIERDIVTALADHEIVAGQIGRECPEERTFGGRLSDAIATFGGSWRFISLFAAVLLVWILANSVLLYGTPFDPYPFILLNLILSCIAAIQAPIIMMSQGRQEARDRLRSEHDYRINLKAELEIRHLHEKIDHLLTHQWERLVEIQQMQLELLNEYRRGSPKE